MSGILQSKSVTPGHLAQWVTDNVLQDAGVMPYSQRVLATLLAADFNTTTDQPIALPTTLQAFQLTGVLIAAASLSLTTAVGGFYPEASKAGSPLVAASQIYTTLTGATLLMNATLTAYAQAQYLTRTQIVDWTIYFSLTTPQGSAAIANIYLLGNELA